MESWLHFHLGVNFLKNSWNLGISVSEGRQNTRSQNEIALSTQVLSIIFLFSYKDVCNACSLDDDLKQMPSGDLTEVILIDSVDSFSGNLELT